MIKKLLIPFASYLIAHQCLAFTTLQITSFEPRTRQESFCSAFVVRPNVLLTANHCHRPGWPIWTYNSWAGRFYSIPGYDIGMLYAPIPSSDYPKVLATKNELVEKLTQIYTNNGRVKTWGRTSGTRSYSIKGLNVEQGKIILDGLAQHGDSGGPVWFGDTLLGIFSGQGVTPYTTVVEMYHGAHDGRFQ